MPVELTAPVHAFVKNLRSRELGDDSASPTYIVKELGFGFRMAERSRRWPRLRSRDAARHA